MWCTKWGKRVSGFITDPHGWFTIQPTTSLAIVHNDVPPALARQVRRDREYIIIYILWYIITYICLRVAGPTSDPHMPFTCLASQHSQTCEMHIWLHIWEHANRHTKRRGMSSTALCRYMSYTVMYMDICMQGTRLGRYMSHILARLDLPHFARWCLLSH